MFAPHAIYADEVTSPQPWGSGAAAWADREVSRPEPPAPKARAASVNDMQRFILTTLSATSTSAFNETLIPQQAGQPSAGAFDRLFRIEDGRRIALRNEIASLAHPWAAQLARRINALIEATREDYPDEAQISVPSLQGFLHFLRETSNLRYPDATISPKGTIRAEWKQNNDRHLAIEFISVSEARYAIVGPDPHHPGIAGKCAGYVTSGGVLKAVVPYRAFEWVCENAGR